MKATTIPIHVNRISRITINGQVRATTTTTTPTIEITNNANSYNSNNNSRRQTHANNFDSSFQNSSSSNNQQAPFTSLFAPDYESNFFTVNVNNVNVSKLIKLPVTIRITNQAKITALALLDSGATHSFISPKMVSEVDRKIILDYPDQFKQQDVTIKSVTGETRSVCAFAEAIIWIGEWKGKHTFIISPAMNKHDVILGRDFLKLHNVVVNHGNDLIEIEGSRVSTSINTVTSEEAIHKPTTNESSSSVNKQTPSEASFTVSQPKTSETCQSNTKLL
jgi:hypothetical protein